MNLKYIGTTRKFDHWSSSDLVYEWEDILLDRLQLTFFYKKLWYIRLSRIIPIINSLTHHGSNTFCFEMTPQISGQRPDNIETIVPCIIDFFLTNQDMPTFIQKYCNNKIVLLSSRESYDFVKDYLSANKILNFKIGHLPLSISDVYAITAETRYVKKYDLVLVGRQNPILEKFLNEYTEKHPDIYYVYRIQTENQFNYYTNRGESLGNINTRDKYMELLRSARCGLYSTPGIDGGEQRTKGFNQVTPRFLELIASGCNIIARYHQNSDTKYYELNKFSPSVNSYEQFEKMLDKARTTDVDMHTYSNYLAKHYTSVRAQQLIEIIKNI